MIVERIWTGNAYRNYNYLIACPETGEALAIDPLDHEKCLHAAKVRGWQITMTIPVATTPSLRPPAQRSSRTTRLAARLPAWTAA